MLSVGETKLLIPVCKPTDGLLAVQKKKEVPNTAHRSEFVLQQFQFRKTKKKWLTMQSPKDLVFLDTTAE
jgi:hypothetical protein